MRYTESLRFRETRERERGGEKPKACLSYWRLSALASGARNTCSDFAVNRRPDDYTLVYFGTIDPDDLRATILSPGSRLYKKMRERERTGFPAREK